MSVSGGSRIGPYEVLASWCRRHRGGLESATTLSPAVISEDGKTVLINYARSLADLYLAEGLK